MTRTSYVRGDTVVVLVGAHADELGRVVKTLKQHTIYVSLSDTTLPLSPSEIRLSQPRLTDQEELHV